MRRYVSGLLFDWKGYYRVWTWVFPVRTHRELNLEAMTGNAGLLELMFR